MTARSSPHAPPPRQTGSTGRSPWQLADDLIGFASRGALGLGTLVIGFVGLWIVTDVVYRSFRLGAISGTHEVVSASLGAVTFLFVPYVFRVGRHIRSTMVVDRLPERGREVAFRASYVIAGVVFALIALSGWRPTVEAFGNGEVFGQGGFSIATFPTRLAIFSMSCLAAVECLFGAVKGRAAVLASGEGAAQQPSEGV